MPDRSDKFSYTDPRQIVTGQDRIDLETLRELGRLVKAEGLDPQAILAAVRADLDAFRTPR